MSGDLLRTAVAVPVIVGVVLLSAVVAAAVSIPIEGNQVELEQDQTAVEQELADLKVEHERLVTWVIRQFKPWVEKQVKRQAALPPGEATPSIPPIPELPISPAPSVTPPPVNLPPVTPPGPTEPPSPSPTPSVCLPVLCSAVP